MTDSSARPFRIVLLGPPASGKGTQGRKLAAALDMGYLSTGALLREQVGNGTALGKLAAPILARGEYLPDEMMCRILEDWLEHHAGGWVLDGFPRSLPQAEFLDGWLARHGFSLDASILLEAPYEELVSRIRERVECPNCRWSGQQSQTAPGGLCPDCSTPVAARADDDVENFTKRYQEFSRLTGPVIEHYRTCGLLKACDATAPQDKVAAAILQLLGL